MKPLTDSEQRDYATMLASETVTDLQARLRSLEATWGPLSSRACVVRGLIDGLRRHANALAPEHIGAYGCGFAVGYAYAASKAPWRPGDGLDTGACPGCDEAKH